MNQMHSSQNILGIKAFLEVVSRGFCETYGTQGQIKPAADGPTQNGATPWDGGLYLAGAHPCRAPPALEPAQETTGIIFQGINTFVL